VWAEQALGDPRGAILKGENVKKIGIVHYQMGRTDGVSLEIEKWKHVLEDRGHEVHLCAGELATVEGTLIEELYHHRPEIERLYENTFAALTDYADERLYRHELYRVVEVLERRLGEWIEDKGIDFLIAENVWSVGINPPAAIALARVRRKYEIPALGHHHDFYWERETGVALTCRSALELAEKYLPPHDPGVTHSVINSIARGEMAERKGIEAAIVPNVFDFESAAWAVDDYNHDFRERIGLREKDVMVLQATRITPRKGIELAVDLVQALNTPERRGRMKRRGLYDGRPFDDDSRIVLVLAGYARDDLTGSYLDRIKSRVEQDGVEALYIEDVVEARRQLRAGSKVYSLWDTYVFADLVTFPSLEEGWGNQFLEGARARQPVVVFEYPVFRSDIKDAGFQVISLGSRIEGRDEMGLARVSQEVLEAAADHTVELLTDPKLRHEAVETNCEIARREYSLEALDRHLRKLIPD
jgi:mannosylglucosylglycerate synthase